MLQKHLTAQKGVPTYGDVLSLTQLTQAQMAGLRVSEAVNRFSGILGDGTDETSLAGLPELLAIYRSKYAADSRTPLPSMPTTQEGLRRVALNYADLPDQDRNLVGVFLQAQTVPVSLAENGESFFTLLTRSVPHTGPTTSIHISLTWAKGVYPLTLPTVLVEDHRDKTEVRTMKVGSVKIIDGCVPLPHFCFQSSRQANFKGATVCVGRASRAGSSYCCQPRKLSTKAPVFAS